MKNRVTSLLMSALCMLLVFLIAKYGKEIDSAITTVEIWLFNK